MKYKDNRSNDKFFEKYKTYENYKKIIIEVLKEITDEELKKAILDFSGFKKSKAINFIEINGDKIDAGLEGIITFCVEHGIETLSSCSGLAEDHIYNKDKEGYLSLKDNENSRKFVDNVWELHWPEPELSYTYFVPSIRIVLNTEIIQAIDMKLKAE